MTAQARAWALAGLVTTVVLVLDQATKALVRHGLALGDEDPVLPAVKLVHTRNSGVAFGTFAAQTLLGTKTPIGKLRGAVHRYYGIPLVVTYHPAALLRNEAWKRPTWEDVKLARRILDRAPGA